MNVVSLKFWIHVQVFLDLFIFRIQRSQFGQLLRQIHEIELPSHMYNQLPVEHYSPKWRQMTRDFIADIDKPPINDPVAIEATHFLREQRDVVLDLIAQAEQLAA